MAREKTKEGREETVEQKAKGQSLLSPQKAFVVQLREAADVEGGQWEGRVEHVVTGQATRFHSLEELVAFIVRVLSQERSAPQKT